MMKRLPTFRTADQILCGRPAINAWRSQRARCDCGYYADPDNEISGAAGNMPARWLGCGNPGHGEVALGLPLVYRLPSQMEM